MYMLPVAMAWSSFDDYICYVLPVLLMISRFHIMGPLARIKNGAYVSLTSPDGGTGGEVALYDYRLGLLLSVFSQHGLFTAMLLC